LENEEETREAHEYAEGTGRGERREQRKDNKSSENHHCTKRISYDNLDLEDVQQSSSLEYRRSEKQMKRKQTITT
jgi:hypothetical protein